MKPKDTLRIFETVCKNELLTVRIFTMGYSHYCHGCKLHGVRSVVILANPSWNARRFLREKTELGAYAYMRKKLHCKGRSTPTHHQYRSHNIVVGWDNGVPMIKRGLHHVVRNKLYKKARVADVLPRMLHAKLSLREPTHLGVYMYFITGRSVHYLVKNVWSDSPSRRPDGWYFVQQPPLSFSRQWCGPCCHPVPFRHPWLWLALS